MTETNAFEIDHLTMTYGLVRALDDVSLTVPAGSVVGLIGRNGAGKSTAIRCLLGLQRPTAGTIRVLDHDPRRLPVAVKQRIGWVSDAPPAFPSATAGDLLSFCAPLYPRWNARLEHELVARLRIPVDERLSSLSLGQQRAVALTLALCPRPDLLVLDEPAANLDAVIRREFLHRVLDLVAEEGRTVLFSSHNLADVERIADRVIFLDRGRVLLHAPLDQLQERTRRLRIQFPGEAPASVDVPGAVATRRSGREVLVTVNGYDESLPGAVATRLGARVDVHPVSLEDLFIDLVGDDDATHRAA